MGTPNLRGFGSFFMGLRISSYWHNKLSENIFYRDKYKCVLCGDNNDLLIDHIIPVKKGGKSTIENQRTLCRSCHSKITNTKCEEKLTKIGSYLRSWREKHPGYGTKYAQGWRKKHYGYFSKYNTSEKWQLYKQSNV
jgi:hypothetical protein